MKLVWMVVFQTQCIDDGWKSCDILVIQICMKRISLKLKNYMETNDEWTEKLHFTV